MKLYSITISLSLMLFAVAAFGQEQSQYEFTLQECLDYALENNQSVIIANLEKQAAKAETQEFNFSWVSTGRGQCHCEQKPDTSTFVSPC
jgi:hypothetical protein